MASFGHSRMQEQYRDQDVLFVLSRNSHDNDKNVYDDIVAMSNIHLPNDGFAYPKSYNQFYNVLEPHKVSYFRETSNAIVS